MTYPKRLIEVDLPIARISAHARREKSIRHGHISTLHIWWARRPLAACRAVICAALWPDPVDPLCSRAFREAAVAVLTAFAKRVNSERITEEKRQLQETLSVESRGRWEALAAGTLTLDAAEEANWFVLRMALLDFIADFANWDNSTVPAYLETSRAITQAAHEALGGMPGTRPLVVDPFAGGGLDSAGSPPRRCRCICQRPQPRTGAAQQGGVGIHPEIRRATFRRNSEAWHVGPTRRHIGVKRALSERKGWGITTRIRMGTNNYF
jgi:hypothetical protein